MKRHALEFVSIGAIIVAFFTLFPSISAGIRPTTLYVGPNGSNLHWGGDPKSPLATIQFASKVVPRGGTVMILPGVYRERPRIRRGGMAGRPTIYRASKPGTAVISGAAAGDFANSSQWASEGEGIFSTRVDRPIYWLTAEGENLFRCNALKEFMTLARREHQMGAFYCDADGILRVVLADRRSPDEHDLRVHGEVFPQGIWRTLKASNLWVEADNVFLDGLRFEFGVGAGVRLWNAANARISDCLFTGAVLGVVATEGLKPASDLRLERCLYHNYPQGEWLRQWLTWDEVYGFHSSHGLVQASGRGSRIAENLMVHGGDGLRANSGRSSDPVQIELSGNLVAYCTDDAVEIEGDARGICFCRNLVYDCSVSLGLSPVLAGPVSVTGNLFLHPVDGFNGAQVKLLGRRELDLRLHPIRDIHISQNVFVGNWLCWYKHPVIHVTVENNLFAVQNRKSPRWPQGVSEMDNRYVELPAKYPDPLKNPDRHRIPPGHDVFRAQGFCAPAKAGPFKISRPGPRWLDWHSLPATKRLAGKMPESLFES